MLIRFLKSGSPAVILLTLVIALLLRTAFVIHEVPGLNPDEEMPLFFHLINTIFHNSYFNALTAFALVILQGFVFNKIVEEQRLLSRFTQLPFAVYLVLISMFPETLYLSSELIALTLLLPATQIVLNLNRTKTVLAHVFNAGMLIGAAALFSLPSVLFVLLLLSGIINFHANKLRAYFVQLIGILIPFYVYWSVLVIFFDGGSVFPAAGISLSFFRDWEPGNTVLVVQTVVLVLLSFITVIRDLSTNTVLVRQSYFLFLRFGLLGVVIGLFATSNITSGLVLAVPAVALLVSNLLFYAQKKILVNAVYLGILVMAVFNLWVL